MATRADRIYEIIKSNGGRMRVRHVHHRLAEVEEVPREELNMATVPATVRTDNGAREAKGQALRFNVHGAGDEEFGYISIIEETSLQKYKSQILTEYEDQIPKLLEAANESVKESLRAAIRDLSWREFESSFMTQVLEALGFSEVQITQPTRDKGIDGRCKYTRGLVQSEALVSAKHWDKNKVRADEIDRMRGKHDTADTAIIFTSGEFSDDAIQTAQPVGAMRSVVLINGDIIVDTCFRNDIGVEGVSLTRLMKFVGFEDESEDPNLED